MAYLPLANILHHKVRSAISAVGIGLGICMVITLGGLSRGSLNEVADRWEAVRADLIVYPLGWGDNVTLLSGIGLSDRYADLLRQRYPDLIQRVVPVFLWQMKVGGADHLAAGVDPQDWEVLVGNRSLREGRLFDPDNRFATWIEQRLLDPTADDAGDGGAIDAPVEIDTQTEFADPAHDGLELVIDDRLAREGRLAVGDTVRVANHDWTIVGIVPAGGMSRVYLPRRTAQFLFGSGSITRSTLLFVDLRDGLDPDAAARRIRGIGQEVVQLRQYRDMLRRKFAVMFRYVDAVNAIALATAFLFIMNTLYTMVLQRTREIAILKSCGASGWYILRQVLGESLLLTGAGAIFGVSVSLLAAWAIGSFTLYTVTVTPAWIALALLAAFVGAVLSALYPAWAASRVAVVEALTLE